jgi:hypothetical protein
VLVSLELIAAPVRDVRAEGDAQLGVLRVTGPAPEIALHAADGAQFALAPGAYVLTLRLRGAGAAAPTLALDLADGAVREVRCDPTSDGAWQAAFECAQTVRGLRLALPGATGAFAVAMCAISTERATPAPSVRVAGLDLARALFRKTPRSVQRALSSVLARRRASAHQRAAGLAADAAVWGGEIRRGGAGHDAAELETRRADFDARFAVARGLRDEVEAVAPRAQKRDARVVAFYLPQFHRIAENDAWWGEGFTEWTNVAKAQPQFLGHHQPRLPGELGFYDLSAPETLRRQVDLARTYGVSAFCFHYYWFGGKRLLERPLDAFLADRSLDLGFTLCWANENWTRRWDGADDQVLIAQAHSPEDHVRVFDDLARYLDDPRAIRIEGKPLLLVYRPAIIGDARRMTKIWRERAAARGWPGLYLAATNAFQFDAAEALGFDALVEFPPHNIATARIEKKLAWLNPNHAGVVFDYEQVVEEAIARLGNSRARANPVFPGVMPSWDNEARRPGAGTIFHNATPGAYARWLDAACAAAERTLPADRRLVFVNAWNEWAEGAYLEPDERWGGAYLRATLNSS